ncbi:MAG: hypothetical protein PHT91_02125 [Candidatus Nanoarchaeia archaeon]|nr:hypothetical protein [Candidatus Nanoarchaeia archaeon]
MSVSYADYLISPNIQALPDFPLLDYDAIMSAPDPQAAAIEASRENLINYLAEGEANRNAFNSSFNLLKTDIYSASGEKVLYINHAFPPTHDLLEHYPYSRSGFASNEINELINNADFAHYASEGNIGALEQELLATDGSMISVDASLAQSMESWPLQGLSAFTAGACFPLMGYGIKRMANGKNKKSKLRGLGEFFTGAVPTGVFAYNIANNASKVFAAENLTSYLAGIRGLYFNSGIFLLGNASYNIISSLYDIYKNMKAKNQGKSAPVSWPAIAIKSGASALEIGIGAYLLNSASAPMLSIAYGGAGMFALSTSGLSSILSSTLSTIIPLGIGLGIAAIAGYAIAWGYKKLKQKKSKSKTQQQQQTIASPHPVSTQEPNTPLEQVQPAAPEQQKTPSGLPSGINPPPGAQAPQTEKSSLPKSSLPISSSSETQLQGSISEEILSRAAGAQQPPSSPTLTPTQQAPAPKSVEELMKETMEMMFLQGKKNNKTINEAELQRLKSLKGEFGQ